MAMKKIKQRLKRGLAAALTAAVIATSFPAAALSVRAEEGTEAATEQVLLENEESKENNEESKESEGTAEEETEDTAAEENAQPPLLFDDKEGTNHALRFMVEEVSGEWTNVVESDITGFGEVVERTADMILSYEIYLPKTAVCTGTYYIKPVMKTGAGWDWKENADAGKNVSWSDFVSCTENENLVKYTFAGAIGENAAGSDLLQAIVLSVGTENCSYSGALFIDTITLAKADGTVVAKQDFTGYQGAVELGDMGNAGGEESGSNVIYENSFDDVTNLEDFTVAELAAGNKALEFTANLSETTGWTDIFKVSLPLANPYTGEVTDKLVMEFDVYFPEGSIGADFGTMKAQAALQVGDGWEWITQKAWPSFTESDLVTEETVTGYKKYHFSIDMNEFQTWDSETGSNKDWPLTDITPIQTVIPCLAGDTSSYTGSVYLDNVKVTAFQKSGTDDPVITEGDIILDTKTVSWKAAEEDWEYAGENTVRNETVEGKTVLAAQVDYSQNAGTGWSEAKFEYTHPETVASMNGYNTFKADVYYKPAARTQGSFKIKVFCESLSVDKDAAVKEGAAVENIAGLEGYYKSEFVVSFNPTKGSFQNLSLGIVGVNTDYKGDIFFDNMRFTQVLEEDIYVDAAIAPVKGNGIRVTEDGRSIVTADGTTVEVPKEAALADAGANEATRKLYAYLSAIGTSDSVIFGHQNDTHHKAGAKGEGFTESDVKDITGSIAGVVGIDTLSLTGNEAVNAGADWNTPQAERIAVVADTTRKAAGQGAVITLSAHMPNFDLVEKKVKAFEEGGKTAATSDTLGYWEDEEGNKTYNFSGYTPGTLSGDVVRRIMPGQDLNYLYTSYLDMVAEYAKAVEKDGVTILFRPFHENTGSWFWWGAALCDEQAYISLYRYTVDYLKETKGVHNMLYVYGPGSEAENVEEYAARYPGDAYVDMIGYDLYHSVPTAENQASYLANVKKQNAILREFAQKHNKLYAITETGVANENHALLPKDNAVKDWYWQLLDAISPDGVCYFLVWANFDDDSSFYTPFVVSKKEDGTLHGHEMLDDFITFYNDSRSVFAEDMNNGYQKIAAVTNTTDAESVSGYINAPLSGSRILGETILSAKVNGVAASETDVCFHVETEFDATVIPADFQEKTGLWEAVLTANELESLGETMGTIALFVKGKEEAKINILFNMPEIEEDPLVPENFENYGGSDDRLNLSWATNKDTGSSIRLCLTKEEETVFGGSYGLKMDVTLAAPTAWAGATKSMNHADWSGGNALEFYTVPEVFGQKVVVQVISGGNVFEVYLQEYAEYTACAAMKTPVKVTIPFGAFEGRDNKDAKFDASAIESIGLWCNAVANERVSFPLKTTLIYDELCIVTTEKTAVTAEAQGVTAKEGIWIKEIAQQTYTGKELKPEVEVYDGTMLLRKNKDYTVKYKNNKNAGTATVEVIGKGNYSEKAETTFAIVPQDISKLTITVSDCLAFTGRSQQIKTAVKDGKRTLNAGKDYKKVITYNGKEVEKACEEGSYTVMIMAGTSGNYTGEQSFLCEVTKKQLLNKAVVRLNSSSLDYNNGEAVTYKAEDITVKIGKTIVPAEEYTVSYENNIELGKNAVIKISAKQGSEKYAGSVQKTFTIKGLKFAVNTIRIDGFQKEKEYTGKAQYQTLTLYGKQTGGREELRLVKNVDYTMTYINNVNAGKAKLTIEGKGKYSGKITKTFTIAKAALTKEMIKEETICVTHNKAGAMPDISINYKGMTLKKDVDYSLSYTDNKKVTTQEKKAAITIKGKGNYKGELRKAVFFEIVPKSLRSEDITVVVLDAAYKESTKEYKPNPVVYDNGKKLEKGKDYQIAYTGNKKTDIGTFSPESGYEAKIIITPGTNGNYKTGNEEDTRTETFRIVDRLIKDAKVTLVNPQFFKKEGVTPTKEDLKITWKNTQTLITQEEYEIVSYSQNQKKGTGVLTIKGLSQYGGTKQVKFKIGARSIKSNIAAFMDSISDFFKNL